MTTRLQSAGPRPNISVGLTAARTTAQPARPFQQLIRASSTAIVATAEQAATRLPGGPILAAALRPVPGSPGFGLETNAPEGPRSALETSGVRSTSSALTPTGIDPTGIDGARGAAGNPASGPEMNGLLSKNADDNMYYLELQEKISHESRTFSALSNVLKARHDTVKNAISNIR
jgi:hypothetical protein